VHFRGHAIECRIYAEDPDNQYLPSPGKITLLHEPSGPGVRMDSGVYEGWTVPTDYDPLLAKLTAYGESRDLAVSRSLRAVNEMFVGGIQTNVSLFRRILADPDFRAGKTDTGYLERLMASGPAASNDKQADLAVIAAGLFAALDESLPNNSAGRASGSNTMEANVSSSQCRWKEAARIEAMDRVPQRGFPKR
jgi:acetyl-CoA carboxylase, biotin carboxylase subunit